MIDKIKAGHAQATSALLRLWLNEDTESGIDLRLFGGKMVRLQLQHMGFFISDAEAQRATFNLRGAAGIKPCILCKNIVAKGYAAVDSTGFFHEINCAQYSQLNIASDGDIFSAIDHLATIVSKKRLEQLEKSSGINWRPHGFWNDPAVRDRLPPSHMLGDPMHIFWANGTMSSEINLFMMAFQNRFGNIGILTDALLGIGFESAGKGAKTVYVKKLLKHKLFQGAMYKGSARECASVMWLIWFAIQTLLIGKNVLQSAIASFSACMELCRTIRRLTYSTTVTENDALLFSSQIDRHQQAFNVAYPDETRPKHHQRYHLVDSMRALKQYVHCEAHATLICMSSFFCF